MVTIGLLFWLGTQTYHNPKYHSHETLLQGIKKGQTLAAMNCAFLGARGLFHAMNSKQIKHVLTTPPSHTWERMVQELDPMAGYSSVRSIDDFLP